MHVQTRNDDGEIPTYETIAEAFKAAEKDPSIWKISWTDKTTNERVRLVRYRIDGVSEWVYRPIMSEVSKLINKNATKG